MAGGQAIDLESVGKQINIAELETMHIHKTGALIRTCIQLAALSCPGLGNSEFAALDSYAKCIGLSFQVQDDILDVTGDTATLGKTQGSDKAHNKPTYPSIIGLQASQEKALELHKQALQALSIFAEEADILRYISAWFVQRRN
jgi:farnesyl diphosphate synthase